MSKTNRYSVIKEQNLIKLRDLREDFARMARDAAYKKAVIEEARAREAEWDTIKASTHRIKQKRLF
jgi:hypothetical protein